MTRLAIIEPTTLLGKELRDSLDALGRTWDQIELLTTDPDEVGAVTEVGRRAAIVQRLEPDSLATSDLVAFCGEDFDPRALEGLSEAATAIFLHTPPPPIEAAPVIAGLNTDTALENRWLLSPHPAAILLSRLCHSLRSLDLREVVGQILEPASAHGQAGVDELLDQTRAILSMREREPGQTFGAQLAFNLLPSTTSTAEIARQVHTVLNAPLQLSVHVVQAGVFHCMTAGLLLRFEDQPNTDAVRTVLTETALVEWIEDGEILGPIAAAASERILVTALDHASSRQGDCLIWAVMDNLTAGGAANAAAIIDACLGGN